MLLLVAALTACTTEDPSRELREVEPCDQGAVGGEPIQQCARACVDAPFLSGNEGTGPKDCKIVASDRDRCDSALSFDVDGVRGCCNETARVDGKLTLTWSECLD